MTDAREPDAVVDLLGGTGTGPLWGMASSDLNATLLAWPPGHELAADTNSELDVLLIVVEGGGVATVDEQEHALVPGSALLIEKGSSRTIRADADGVRYVSVHRRRGPLQITWPGSRAASSAPTALCGGSSGTTERRRVEAELREAQRSFEASRDEVRVLADEQAALRLVATPHWLNHYNEQRRHSAIGNQPPISRVRNLPGQDS